MKCVHRWVFGLCVSCLTIGCLSCSSASLKAQEPLVVGDRQMQAYLPLLQGKRVAVVANHTSMIGSTHLVDSLLRLKIAVVKVFSPEHGFRGTVENGASIDNDIDTRTQLPIISLYGNHKKPTKEDLNNVDLVLFDLQDVGARFYTYISTLHYVMEAGAEQQVPVVVLDRPNPHAHYVDGPILEDSLRSFVGMHPVPVVYGLTIGEYARMINGEYWLADSAQCSLTVIPNLHYTHHTSYVCPIAPSPNLQTARAIGLYPSLCFFEGTSLSVGRGTDFPFMIFGHPDLADATYVFTPRSIPGASVNPPLLSKTCYGVDLSQYDTDSLYAAQKLNLSWILFAYHHFNDKTSFFNAYFNTLAGTRQLRRQIEQGWSENEIRETWQPELTKFREIRKKYLLYEE